MKLDKMGSFFPLKKQSQVLDCSATQLKSSAKYRRGIILKF